MNQPNLSANDDLYVMQLGKEGPIKIGRSRNVYNRQVNLQANSPFEVVTILTVRGHGPLEPLWHRAFADAHLRGEWFDWTPEVKDALAAYRAGDDWWRELLPPFDLIADATVDFLEDGQEEEFEEAYAKCVAEWRWQIEYDLASATVQIEEAR